jgi:hypothetical protein
MSAEAVAADAALLRLLRRETRARPHPSVRVPYHLPSDVTSGSAALARASAAFVPAAAAYAELQTSLVDTGDGGARARVTHMFLHPDNALHSVLHATLDVGTHVRLLAARAKGAAPAGSSSSNSAAPISGWEDMFGAFLRPGSSADSRSAADDAGADVGAGAADSSADWSELLAKPSVPHLHPLTTTPLTGPSSWAVLAGRLDLLADELDRGVRECGTVLKPPVPALSPSAASAVTSTAVAPAATVVGGEYLYALEPSPSYLAFETDGYGSTLFLDDANLPSLLSLPYLSYLAPRAPAYRRTRARSLSAETNPYFFSGPALSGVGGPHVGLQWVWPMSLIVQGLTLPPPTQAPAPGAPLDADDRALLALLRQLLATAATGSADRDGEGLGFIKESVDVTSSGPDPGFTRPWFAWANGLFGELVIHLAKTRPWLIFDPSLRALGA